MDAVYIGGGYPELHASGLERSKFRKYFQNKVMEGMPVYGECGLDVSLQIHRNRYAYAMLDVLPGPGQ